ncbi:DNA methyltransferase [Mycoplasma leachii]|uniref:Putative C5 methylase (Part of ICE) n=1 Tax=Mycoplasma leachii 06049 TaxID=1188244 RepID=A0A2T4IAV0_9MOLU|nr:DNA methyltransferase [Mycoplasma leachii]PTD31822.1 putative C5 methylase (part of ICE) [Mycoplasma leachii 06049]
MKFVDSEFDEVIWDPALVIWTLFDDGNSSYQKAITKNFNQNEQKQFVVISIGSKDPKDISFNQTQNSIYKQIDLSLTNPKLIQQLKELPKPDIILASPPCESWSAVDCAGQMFSKMSCSKKLINDDTSIWEIRNRRYYEEYNKHCKPQKRRRFVQKEITRLQGVSTIGATLAIIATFQPNIWVIENPASSKTWEFQKKHWNFNGYHNLTYYYNYDLNYSKKPTIFKSNIKMNLFKKKLKTDFNKDHCNNGNYEKRSNIPENLIVHIIEEIKTQYPTVWNTFIK